MLRLRQIDRGQGLTWPPGAVLPGPAGRPLRGPHGGAVGGATPLRTGPGLRGSRRPQHAPPGSAPGGVHFRRYSLAPSLRSGSPRRRCRYRLSASPEVIFPALTRTSAPHSDRFSLMKSAKRSFATVETSALRLRGNSLPPTRTWAKQVPRAFRRKRLVAGMVATGCLAPGRVATCVPRPACRPYEEAVGRDELCAAGPSVSSVP